MEKALKDKLLHRMDAALDILRKEFNAVRTGRASLALLEGIMVDYYNTPTPLQQVAALSVPESRLIVIQPWEQKMIGEIERALMKSDLGLTPANDGKLIRLPIPMLTEERRRELVKVVRKKAEETRVALRNVRRDMNEGVKKLEKDQHMSEDEVKKTIAEVQKITDSYIEKVDGLLETKEKEIMEV
ncbi:MAG: ribosome recycling factor [Nitrospiraceae bacterium]|nr:ribosome recycling factor [Nitrospiraceae bacterium]